jgi:hypothetical protein
MWFAVLWYYWQGRNWARILLLIETVVSVVLPFVDGWDRSLVSSFNVVSALLGAFLLVWLNRKEVKDFFKTGRNRRIDWRERWARFVCVCMMLWIVMRWAVAITTSFWLTSYGSSAWEQTKVELRAKGEKLTFKELVPPAPPDSENFFADPIWRQLSDFVSVKQGDHIVQELKTPKEKWIIRQPQTPLSSGELAEKTIHSEEYLF